MKRSHLAFFLIIFLSMGYIESYVGTCPTYLGSTTDGQSFFVDKDVLRVYDTISLYILILRYHKMSNNYLIFLTCRTGPKLGNIVRTAT